MIGHILGFIPMNSSYWKRTRNKNWEGLIYIEAVLNFTDLPPKTYGKIYVEWADDTPHEPLEHELEVRLSYQQEVGIKVPIIGSNIRRRVKKLWQLDESGYFPMPTDVPNVSCLWIEGRVIDGGECAVALANLLLVARDE